MVEVSLFEKYRRTYASAVDWFVYTELGRGAPKSVYDAALYLYRSGGKRVRPFVVMATARMLGGLEAETAALPLAAAVELFHNFTLIHDDIMDQDDFRRGVPTTHRVYGIDFAILAGDLAYALSYKAISLAGRFGLSAQAISRAYGVLTEAAVRVSEGQAYDMSFEKEKYVDYNDYLNMIYLKTGALLEASAKMGAIASMDLAGGDKKWDIIVEKMGSYGKFVGLAFQIRDDILGVFGDPQVTGKPRYNDLIRGKKTLLVLYAYKHASDEDRRLLEKVLERRLEGSEEELEKIADIIRSTGALDYAQKLARQYSEIAIEIVDSIEPVDEDAARALKELARFVVERNK